MQLLHAVQQKFMAGAWLGIQRTEQQGPGLIITVQSSPGLYFQPLIIHNQCI